MCDEAAAAAPATAHDGAGARGGARTVRVALAPMELAALARSAQLLEAVREAARLAGCEACRREDESADGGPHAVLELVGEEPLLAQTCA